MTLKGNKRVRQLSYREVFFAHNGPGPYPCFFCEEEVNALHVYVHHEDHDKQNNAPSNLKAAHGGCHATHHATGRQFNHTEEWKAELSRRLKGKPLSPEHVAAAVAGRRAAAAKRGAKW